MSTISPKQNPAQAAKSKAPAPKIHPGKNGALVASDLQSRVEALAVWIDNEAEEI